MTVLAAQAALTAACHLPSTAHRPLGADRTWTACCVCPAGGHLLVQNVTLRKIMQIWCAFAEHDSHTVLLYHICACVRVCVWLWWLHHMPSTMQTALAPSVRCKFSDSKQSAEQTQHLKIVKANKVHQMLINKIHFHVCFKVMPTR